MSSFSFLSSPGIIFLSDLKIFTVKNPKLSRLRPSMGPDDVPGGQLPSAFYRKQAGVNNEEMTLIEAHECLWQTWGQSALLSGARQATGPVGLGFLSFKSRNYED